MSHVAHPDYFTPCAATAARFLYASGSSIISCQRDTLIIERQFTGHDHEIQLLAVDNYSERGRGRLAMSYDAGQTGILWDLMTGDEVARFASSEHLTVAAWMKNGTLSFGTAKGSIVTFQPSTSEHVTTKTIDSSSISALAPCHDCRTFAIGHLDGSLLVATLRPRFTILHNLTNYRRLSPIANLAWHDSPLEKKSGKLAVQMRDGDLRVWSVPRKCSIDDSAKVVRILKESEISIDRSDWMAWSKHGRIIHYSDSHIQSWDVRTNQVTADLIPTLDCIRGLAVYGPGATLFTLGPRDTAQQFDLSSPAIMVANVQHPARRLPPTPVVLKDFENTSEAPTTTTASEYKYGSNSRDMDSHMSAETPMRPSTMNNGNGNNSAQRSSRHIGACPRQNVLGTTDALPMPPNYLRRMPSLLRNDVPYSTDDGNTHDIFKSARTRVDCVLYEQDKRSKNGPLTGDNLHHQMLNIIFGWNKEIEDLVRYEIDEHPPGSPNRILLAKWLDSVGLSMVDENSENISSRDWRLLTLSGIGGKAPQAKLSQAHVHKLLEAGHVHTAVTIMLEMGEHSGAIDIYVSLELYMEALILTCLTAPHIWKHQAAVIRKWGEWAVLQGQQQLAIRCFACTVREHSEILAYPSAAMQDLQSMTPSILCVQEPPRCYGVVEYDPRRSITETSAVKLITSFDDQPQTPKFCAGNRNLPPLATNVHPIGDFSGLPITYDISGNDATTSFPHPSSSISSNTVVYAQTQKRLSPIYETASDVSDHSHDVSRSARHFDTPSATSWPNVI
ncbi:WD G-beta repeat [Fusarium heterosporum]|uniref:WD G-beta repeat n=1 Tax=Fusarium heterosporum TaxID=42747 RepID=A0A8H5X1W4_FUSHE|nr:WD G-beta repeat [Fusarium heterosporum]